MSDTTSSLIQVCAGCGKDIDPIGVMYCMGGKSYHLQCVPPSVTLQTKVPATSSMSDVEKVAERIADTVSARLDWATRGNGWQVVYDATLSALGDQWKAAIEVAAQWHAQRAIDTPDAFEMEFHQKSAMALRALRRPASGEKLCEDCPPEDYPTDATRCWSCPRKQKGPAR